ALLADGGGVEGVRHGPADRRGNGPRDLSAEAVDRGPRPRALRRTALRPGGAGAAGDARRRKMGRVLGRRRRISGQRRAAVALRGGGIRVPGGGGLTMKRSMRYITIWLVLSALPGQGQSPPEPVGAQSPEAPATAPPFTLADVQGRPQALADYRGRSGVLFF